MKGAPPPAGVADKLNVLPSHIVPTGFELAADVKGAPAAIATDLVKIQPVDDLISTE